MACDTTAEAFATFDRALNLDPDERAAAQDLHNALTDLLIAKGIARSAFLQGSFARKTMLAPLHDVDKIIVLHSSMADLTPDEVMDEIQSVIESEYPDSTFDRSRHALKVQLDDYEFHFDCVPAWELDNDDGDVEIANRDSEEWDWSNTRTLIRVVADRNGETNGRFIHWVRMAKHAVARVAGNEIPGLHVESWPTTRSPTPLTTTKRSQRSSRSERAC